MRNINFFEVSVVVMVLQSYGLHLNS